MNISDVTCIIVGADGSDTVAKAATIIEESKRMKEELDEVKKQNLYLEALVQRKNERIAKLECQLGEKALIKETSREEYLRSALNKSDAKCSELAKKLIIANEKIEAIKSVLNVGEADGT